MDDIFLNGNFIAKSEASVSIMDRGFLFGDGVYELIPVYNKKPFLINKHLARLKNSLNMIGMKEIDNIKEDILRFINRSNETNYHIYLHITRGEQSYRNHVYPNDIKPTIMIMSETYPCFNEIEISAGFKATVQNDFRWQKSNIKSISLLGNVLLKKHASENNCYESLLIKNELLTEGSASNVFIVKDKTVYTPKLNKDLLPGVTRDFLIEMLDTKNISVKETDITLNNLLNSDEIWCSSSTNPVVPIIKVDDSIIGKGKVGKYSLLAFKEAQGFITSY